MPPPLPLFIASIGNPTPYLNTLHSAGHTVIHRVGALLGCSTFIKDRSYGNGALARTASGNGGSWTLWQSPTLMNVSGPTLKKAWDAWRRDYGLGPDGVSALDKSQRGILVVLHDELEKPLGKVVFKKQGSAKGHNGLKSILASMPGIPFVRIGVGIGRPESRHPDDVADYVLSKMNEREKKGVEGAAEEVIRILGEIEMGKR